MTFARRLPQTLARLASPILHKVGLGSALSGVQTYSAFIAGQGAGSGWDHLNEIKAAASFIRRSAPVIFDVGANDGSWSLDMARQLGDPAARFYLFECAPYCFAGIDKRIGGIPNATVLKCAVSDEEGTATLHLPTRGSGLASLHERKDVCIVQETYEPVEVATRTLDGVAKSHSIDRIDLLKLDIEGHELFALAGAKDLLSSGKVDALFFEFGSGNVNSRTYFRDFWELLTPLGYRIHRILPGGATIPIRAYSEKLEYFRGATNYLARRD